MTVLDAAIGGVTSAQGIPPSLLISWRPIGIRLVVPSLVLVLSFYFRPCSYLKASTCTFEVRT